LTCGERDLGVERCVAVGLIAGAQKIYGRHRPQGGFETNSTSC
jgi:hypothetical protein